jgi:hypothetical protein
MENPAFWPDLATRFQAIPDPDPRNRIEAGWRADGWGKGWGKWLLLGDTESNRDLCRTVARLGAVALGHPGGEGAYAFWLDRLRRDSVDYRGRAGVESEGEERANWEPETGVIPDFCGASARYCLRCQAEALEVEHRLRPSEPHPAATVRVHDSAPPFPREADPTGRRALVGTFLANCRPETSVKVLKKHLWLAVRHKTSRQFEYWQAGVDRVPGSKSSRGANRQDDRNFRRILAMKPEEFVDLLRNVHIVYGPGDS